jgi:hypothetical protein
MVLGWVLYLLLCLQCYYGHSSQPNYNPLFPIWTIQMLAQTLPYREHIIRAPSLLLCCNILTFFPASSYFA